MRLLILVVLLLCGCASETDLRAEHKNLKRQEARLKEEIAVLKQYLSVTPDTAEEDLAVIKRKVTPLIGPDDPDWNWDDPDVEAIIKQKEQELLEVEVAIPDAWRATNQ